MEGAVMSVSSLTGVKIKDKKTQADFAAEIISEIEAVSRQLNDINEKYNLTTDNDLIDSLIYEELSLRARYSYLLRMARNNNVHYQGNFITEG